MTEPSQILIVRLSSVGDVLLATPLVRVLRRAYPRARLRFLVKPAFADLLRWNPHLDGVLTWPDDASDGDSPAGRAAGVLSPAVRELAREGRGAGPLWLVDLQASPRSRAYAALLRPARAFRYPKPYVRRQLLLRAKLDRFAVPSRSIAERYFDALRPLGLRPDAGGLELVTGQAADQRAAEVLDRVGEGGSAEGWIAVAPGARWATKRWPPESFATAARALAEETGAGVVVLGGLGDLGPARAVERMLAAAGVRALPLAGALSLLETAAVLRRCRVALANDSGATHLAAAVATPVVALFGSTAPQFGFAPYGVPSSVLGVPDLPCRPCTHFGREACPLGHFRCMRGIAPARVVTAAREVAATDGRDGSAAEAS